VGVLKEKEYMKCMIDGYYLIFLGLGVERAFVYSRGFLYYHIK